jgi:hypothetical protein
MSAGNHSSPLFFEHVLNHIPLVTLEEAAKKMDNVNYIETGDQEKTFDFGKVRECLRKCVVWAESMGQAQGQELYDAKVALQQKLGSKEMGVEGMAALRAYTCTPMCFVLNSVIRSTKIQISGQHDPVLARIFLDPVLAYAKLLLTSLRALPRRFLFVGTLYRSEAGVTDTWKEKKELLDKKDKEPQVRHNFYCPTSFSTNPVAAAKFKEEAVDKQNARTSFTLYGAAGYDLKEFSEYPHEGEVLIEPVCCCNVEKMEIPQDQFPGELTCMEGLYTMELRVRSPSIRLLLCSLRADADNGATGMC